MSPTTMHVPVAAFAPRPVALSVWEQRRARQLNWFVELVAEATGTFLYTFCGTGAMATFVLGNILDIPGLGSLFQVGAAYSVGIALALVVSLATSVGQFNPSITVHAVLFKKFPVWKGVRYIIAQIFGSYLACMVVYVQYKQLIHLAVEGLQAAGTYDTLMFTPNGPGGIFGFYVTPGSNLGYVALNEFVCDFVLALVIFSCTEPSNHLSTPTTMPWLIALAYGVVVWGFGPIGLAANAARDLGGRFAAMTIFGSVASGGSYGAITALMSFPATLLAGVFYELVFNDSNRSMNPQWQEMYTGMHAEMERKAEGGAAAPSLHGSTRSDEKLQVNVDTA
ncbi:aquaporin-like protein [Daedaleopsis nitida]|nr:aquaporin-like protein [Daedaleopsis nitida]